MKRETFRHPKILDLASRLGCSRPEAIGYLTLLWDFTAEYAIQGDIGKHADGAIAGACDYRGDAQTFIQSLVESRWLDLDPDYRLLVHDWSEHCERWVKLKMEKIKKSFIESFVKRSAKPSIEPTIEQPTGASPSCDQSNPIQSNPIQTEGAEKSAPTLPDGLNLEAWDRWLKFRRKAKFKPYVTDEAAKSLAQHPPDVQAAAVQHSIEKQYQGLFPEKFTGGPNAKDKRNGEHLTPVQKVQRAFAERRAGGEVVDSGSADLRGQVDSQTR
jgi:hypothetical protein